MITQSIKIHEETYKPVVTQSYHSSYSHTPYNYMNADQKKAWDAEIDTARAAAKAVYKVGDKFNLKTGSQVVVTGFVETNSDVIRARDEPCVIYAVCPAWTNAQPVRYSLGEIQPDTHVPAEPIITITSVEDATNEIPE